MMQGLILAAGRGSRMGTLTDTGPKCLLEVGDRSLLDRQVAALRSAGVRRVGVVGGWRAESLLGRGVRVLENPCWNQSTMVGSLCIADRWLRADATLVAYGDIAFAPEAARQLATCRAPLALAYHVEWERIWRQRFADPLEDAETFAVDAQGRVTAIGERPRSPDEVSGQYMGLTRWTPAAWSQFGPVLHGLQQTPDTRRIDMTAALRHLIEGHGAQIIGVAVRAPWFEFDSASDIDAGQSTVAEIDRQLARR